MRLSGSDFVFPNYGSDAAMGAWKRWAAWDT